MSTTEENADPASGDRITRRYDALKLFVSAYEIWIKGLPDWSEKSQAEARRNAELLHEAYVAAKDALNLQSENSGGLWEAHQ